MKINPGILKFLFVFVQFGGMAFLAISGPVFAKNLALLSVELLGVFIGSWAILSMKIDNLRILPDLKEGARLVKSGPYKLIRHPMYLSIILTFIPLVINYFSIHRLIVYCIICVDLLLKLNYEEKILLAHFEDYKAYKEATYRVIPLIY